MKLSIIIPHFPSGDKKNKMLKECVNSFIKPLKINYELIIIVNEGIGFAKAVNNGLEIANGDFLCILNNDTILEEGSLMYLCDEDAVVSPIVNGHKQEFWGCCFCIPRKIYEKIGKLDEKFLIGYFEDDDYLMRLKQKNIKVRCNERVKIKHLGGETITTVFNAKKIYDKNKKIFEEKWNIK